MRIAFMGTPDFSVAALKALLDAGHEVAAVYCQPPRPAGRGHKLQASPVQAFAEARGLTVRHPKSLRNVQEQADFAALQLDAAVVVAYGLILPPAILEAPRLGCFNIHASLLPRWRGAAPIQRAIEAGDAQTGVTIMAMDAGLDTGPMLRLEATPIDTADTAATLHDRLSAIGARLIVEELHAQEAGESIAVPQPAAGVTYAAKLVREDGRIDLAQPARAIDRRIRAMTPWPGAFLDAPGGERIKVLAAERVLPPEPAEPGTLLDRDFTLACGDEAIRLLRVQRAGKPATDGRAFLNGSDLAIGDSLLVPAPAP